MATPDVADILRLQGTLIKTPTNLSAAYPYGGTVLGLTRANRWIPGVSGRRVAEQSFGGIATEVIETYPDGVIFATVLREWDDDAIVATVQGASVPAGGTGARVRLHMHASTGNRRPGARSSDRAHKLLFAPKDTTAPHILLYHAMPLPEARAAIELALPKEFGLPVVFECGHDATYRVYDVGYLGDLTI